MTNAPDLPFFDQLGIPNVVWLDDLFDAKQGPDEIEIVEAVAAAAAAGTLAQHPKLADLSPEDSAQEWARQIRARLEESEIIEYLRQISTQPTADEQPQQPADYAPGELESVVVSLSSTMRRVGLGRWLELKEELIGAATTGVFLVDRERLLGEERTNVGDDIVKELIARCPDDVFVIVLTHSVGPEGTEPLRTALATDLDIPAARIGVVSKRPGGASLAGGVRAAVRITLTQLTCTRITGRIAFVMRKSLDETEAALERLPVQAIDLAVFENSLNEGSSELDVLSRILSSRQRTAVDAHIAGSLDDVHSPLSRMRKLRLLEPLPELPPADASVLRQWRRDEVFDAGERLNAVRAPLSCGDVFQKNGAKNFYVLLGQPCDLMVRADGTRSADEAVLVKMSFPFTPAAASDGRFFEVPPLEGTDRWALDFRKWVSVNLDSLEWTSFNSEGRVEFSPLPNVPSGLLPGWQQRFRRAANKFKEGRLYHLSLGDLAGAATVASATAAKFPYRRVARLRSPRAAGAYAAFATFHARSAFDHDFAKGVDESSKTE